MMTAAIGRRLLRFVAVVALAGLAVGCASSRGPESVTAPPGYGKDTASRVVRLMQYCDRLKDKGELVTALGLCARAHEIDPDNPEPLMKVATILQALERPQAAVETYTMLLQRHPRHHEAQYSLGKLYMETGEADMASIYFNHAMRSNPDDPRPYNALGILRDQAGEHEAAQGLYRLALERDPKNQSVRNNLGLSLALDGKRDEAIELLAALAVEPEAGQTVMRNLEAAYGQPVMPMPDEAAADTEFVDPPAPMAMPPIEATPLPAAEVRPSTEPNVTTQKPAPGAPEAGAPMPLYLPPAAKSGKPEPTGGQQSDATPAGSQVSAIQAAAHKLMQPPEWADFEPGVLLGQMPPSDPSPAPEAEDDVVGAAGSGMGEAGDASTPGSLDLSMLWLPAQAAVA